MFEKDALEITYIVNNALSKQIPRPIDKVRTICAGMPICDCCKGAIHKSAKYCPHCGQKIDWRKTEWI